MKRLFIIVILFFSYIENFAQIQDTIYVDEIDTVIVEQKPLILNQTIYTIAKVNSKTKFALIVDAGVLKDYNYSYVCETCKENYLFLKNSSRPTYSVQCGIKSYFQFKNLNFGFEANYRNAKRSIDYDNDSTIQFKNKTCVKYFIVGPMVGYKIIRRKKWDLDVFGSANFSFTLKQSGISIGGENINTQIDLSSTPIYSTHNLLYHLSPSFTFKIHELWGISTSLHYYFDHNSNLNKKQSYTEQRNSIGFSLGIK